MIRTRIAPSPTGFAHIGTGYMALFNYAFAKKNNGTFIVRLEDSDTKRHVEEAEVAIYSGLTWLGLTWEEGPDKGGPYAPYRTSERLPLYKKIADKLVEEGKAYEDEGAIRFKNTGEDMEWNDLVRGNVKFPGSETTDFVIMKSDGFPTYNFYVVIDDVEMKITHVIRGEEHISNTPRQLALYKALGYKIPEFAHLPTLRRADGKKLSKRSDPVDLRMFREEGYLPEAILNFLGLLGWSHPDGKEIFNLDEFVEVFDISRVRKSGPFFDYKKLDWLNGMYIREKTDEELAHLINQKLANNVSVEFLVTVVPLLKERMSKLTDAESLLTIFLEEPKISRELFEDTKALVYISTAFSQLSELKSWTLDEVNLQLANLIKEKEFKTGDFYMNLRLALSGKRITPPINESMVILGSDVVLRRLEIARNELLVIETSEEN